jgi:hypothetical protein
MTERKAKANAPLKPKPGLNGPPARAGDMGQDDGEVANSRLLSGNDSVD